MLLKMAKQSEKQQQKIWLISKNIGSDRLQFITKDQMEYILSHTTEKVCITVVNRQRPKKKHRYIALDNNVKHLLDDYQKKQKIIYKSD